MLKLKKIEKNYEKNNKMEMKNTKQNYLENNEENCKNKNKDKTKHSDITQYKSIFEFRFNKLIAYNYSFILFIILLVKCSYFLCKFKFQYSEVTLKIKETGNIKILSDSFFQLYNQCNIYINEIFQTTLMNEYLEENEENINIVKIIWNTDIASTESMFLKFLGSC